MDPEARARGRERCVCALAERRAKHDPLLVVIEDIHWASAVELDALAAMAVVTRAGPVLLVATSRREGDPIDAGWRSRAGPALAMLTIDLAPLQPTEALELAERFGLSQAQVSPEFLARAEGNPLFIEQLLRGVSSPKASCSSA
jgi:predicted ATPase